MNKCLFVLGISIDVSFMSRRKRIPVFGLHILFYSLKDA